MPVARVCPKYHTHNVMAYTCVLENVVLVSLSFTVSPVGHITVTGTTDGGQRSVFNPTHTLRPVVAVSSSKGEMTSNQL